MKYGKLCDVPNEFVNGDFESEDQQKSGDHEDLSHRKLSAEFEGFDSCKRAMQFNQIDESVLELPFVDTHVGNELNLESVFMHFVTAVVQ